MKKKEVAEWMRWLSETGARKTLLSVLEEEARHYEHKKKQEGEEA